jgi:hypothetical protein
MIKVFEIILCMYLKTISPDVPRFTFVCSMETSYINIIHEHFPNNSIFNINIHCISVDIYTTYEN